MLWHSPLLFQKQTLAGMGKAPDHWDSALKTDAVKNMYLPMGLGVVCSALSLYVLIHFLHFIKNGLTREGATSIVFWGWLGFSALPGFATLAWENGASNLSYFLVVQGHRFLATLVAAIVYVELAQARKSAPAAAASAPTADKPSTPRGRSRSPRARSAKKAN